MKRSKRRLPVPQWEFGFTPNTFNLILETGVDGERIAREHEQVEKDREFTERAQTALFQAAR
jgi:hypothetical protein